MDLDFSKVDSWKSFSDRATKDLISGIRDLRAEAQSYLRSRQWCLEIIDEYVGLAYPGIVAVFLYKIVPARPEVDEWVWIVVGDLPPAYITCEASPNPACALDSYIGAMTEWVEAATEGRSVDHLIPVNVAPTRAYADQLRTRLKFLDDNILSNFTDDLKS